MAVKPNVSIKHRKSQVGLNDIEGLTEKIIELREEVDAVEGKQTRNPKGNPKLAAKNAGIGGDASIHRQAPIGPFGLTMREAKFVEGLIGGLNYSAAYREAYDTAHMTDRSVNTAASQLHMKPKVQAAISDAMERAGKALIVSAASLTMMTKRAYDVGENAGNPGAMVNAVSLMAKLNGLIVDRSERKVETVNKGMDREEMVEELRKLTSALGISIVDVSPSAENPPALDYSTANKCHPSDRE